MSGLFGSTTIPGNRLTDFADTTATVGIPKPYGYGTVPFDGNVMWAALPPKEHVTKKRQGKGGTKTETYTYTLSYAVAFCEGPIYGFLWIKRNGKIVYSTDPNAPTEDKLYALKWAQKVQFYLGTETQLPDSTIESYEGTGQVSAHRGVAFIVVEDDDVTDQSGAVPTYEACCICSPPEVYLTSRPYNVVSEDNLSTINVLGLNPLNGGEDFLVSSVSPKMGKLNEIVIPYNYWPREDTKANLVATKPGQLRSVVVDYSMLAEYTKANAVSTRNGLLYVALVPYDNWPAEYVRATGVSTKTGTLT